MPGTEADALLNLLDVTVMVRTRKQAAEVNVTRPGARADSHVAARLVSLPLPRSQPHFHQGSRANC